MDGDSPLEAPPTPSDGDGDGPPPLLDVDVDVDENEDSIVCIVCQEIVDTDTYVAHLNEHMQVWPSIMVVMPFRIDEYEDYEYLTELGNAIGNVPRGFRTREEADRVMNGITLLRGDGTLCTVCQEALGPETDAVELLCGHRYCRGCIAEWLQLSKRCPVCSRDLEELVYVPALVD